MKARFGVLTANRSRNCRAILDAPRDYQCCEGCDGVMSRALVRCPLCNAYRFDPSPERVRQRARAIARRRPEPLTSQPIDDTDE